MNAHSNIVKDKLNQEELTACTEGYQQISLWLNAERRLGSLKVLEMHIDLSAHRVQRVLPIMNDPILGGVRVRIESVCSSLTFPNILMSRTQC